MAKTPLQRLSDLGQSVWIDYLSRDLVEGGELARLIDGAAVVGVTSNPTIFQKALSQGNAYDAQLSEVLAETERPEGDLHPARGQGRRRCLRDPSARLGDDRRA